MARDVAKNQIPLQPNSQNSSILRSKSANHPIWTQPLLGNCLQVHSSVRRFRQCSHWKLWECPSLLPTPLPHRVPQQGSGPRSIASNRVSAPCPGGTSRELDHQPLAEVAIPPPGHC